MSKTQLEEQPTADSAARPSHEASNSPPHSGQRSAEAMFDRVGSLQFDAGLGKREFRRNRSRWRLVLTCGMVIAVAAGAYVLAPSQRALDFREALGPVNEWLFGPVRIEALVVQEESPVPILFDTAGYLIPKATVQVSPNVAGTIVELPTLLGQTIKKGDVLAILDDVTFRADFQKAKSEVELAQAKHDELTAGSRPEEIGEARALVKQAEVRLGLAEAEFRRAVELHKKRAMPRHEYEQILANRDELRENVNELKEKLRAVEIGPREEVIAAAAAELGRAQAVLDKMEYFYESTRVTAPIDGTILQLQAELGETVRPEAFGSENGLSTSLCVMADLSELEVEIDIPEQDVHRVRLGQYCEVTIEAAPDRIYEAAVSRRTPTANRQRGVVEWRVRILEPDEYLLPYMNCRVLLYEDKPSPDDEPVIRVPREVLRSEAAERFVWVHDGERARRRSIEVEETDDSRQPSDFLVVRSGLSAGDVVLLPGDTPLEDGQAVRVQ